MHAALWTTVEAEDEAQPQRHVDRDFWLAADARVDNRDELTAILEGTSRQPLHTDADLILAAYERWGAGLLDHVVGDFGFVLWDGEREELLVARDPFGLRPVFLARTARRSGGSVDVAGRAGRSSTAEVGSTRSTWPVSCTDFRRAIARSGPVSNAWRPGIAASSAVTTT